MTVLFAYDGSEAAESALLDLPRAGLPAGSSIVVLTVDEPSDPLIDFDITTITRHHRRAVDPRRIAYMAEERLEMLLPGVRVSSRSAVGAIADTICGMAELEHADLVVVGAGADNPLARLHLGGSSSRVTGRSRCSVRVARNRHPGRRYGPLRIVVGVDGSRASRAAVDALRERELPAGSEIWLVSAIEPGVRRDERHETEAEAHALHRLYRLELETPGTSVHDIVRDGDAPGVLLELVDETDADALFVGTSGGHGLFGSLLGSTARTVAERAECSVEIVRRFMRGPVP